MKVARPYAHAAFEWALENDVLTSWQVALNQAAEIVVDKQFKTLIFNPLVDNETLLACLIELLTKKPDKHITQFFKLLIQYERLLSLPNITAAFNKLVDEHNNVVQVKVISARPLNDDVKTKLTDVLKEKLKSNIALQSNVDETLLAGAQIYLGDTLIDSSLQGRLKQLGEALL